jgi:hypothetical protein
MEYAGAWVHEKLLGKVKRHHFRGRRFIDVNTTASKN